MIVTSSQAVAPLFTIQDAVGEAVNADSLPTGTLYLNGTANGAVVTVSNVSTGLYKAAFTTPAGMANYDQLQLVIAATIDGTPAKASAWGAACLAATIGEVEAEISSFSSAALQQLIANPISITQPLGANLAVSITRGMDYDTDQNRAITWTDSAIEWPVLTAATITVAVWGKSGVGRVVKSFTGAVVVATGDTKQVKLELTAAQTKGMAAGDWQYGVKATLSGGAIVDLVKPVHAWKVIDFPEP